MDGLRVIRHDCMEKGENLKISQTEWNGSLGYIETIDWLLRTSHIASMDDEDVYDWFMALEQLSIEVSGQYFSKEEKVIYDEIESTRKATLKNFIKQQKELKNNTHLNQQDRLIALREIIRPFHLLINKYAHMKGLRMQAKQNINIEDLV